MKIDKNIVIVGVCVLLLFLYFKSKSPPPQENFYINSLKENLAVVDPTFKDLDIRESDSSYTEDKTTIYLCLKNKDNKVYNMNTVMYVALHEIAHLLNHDNYGHTPEFQKIFDDLLCKAAAKGVYDPNKPHDDFYCGVDIRGISMPTCSIN